MANSADPDLKSQLIWIYTVWNGRVYPGLAGQGLKNKFIIVKGTVFQNWG